MTSRKKPGVAFWATVVVIVGLLLYPLSIGPAYRVAMRIRSRPGPERVWPMKVVEIVYAPAERRPLN